MNNETVNSGNNVQTSPTNTTPSKGLEKKVFIITGYVVLVAVIGAMTFLWNQRDKEVKTANSKVASLESKVEELNKEVEKRKETTGEDKIDKEGFQAVFLTSGQVYFGKITSISETILTLENIYYIRENSGSDISLVKLGSELHGPEDIMQIERKNVQFWENQKPDSQVTKAIVEYEKANPQ